MLALLSAMLLLIGKVTNNSAFQLTRNFYQQKDHIDTIVAGASHARSIHAGTISNKSYNFATSSGDLEIVNLKIRAALSHATEVRRVIITFGSGYFNFCTKQTSPYYRIFYSKLADTPIPANYHAVPALDYIKILSSKILHPAEFLGGFRPYVKKLIGALFPQLSGDFTQASDRIQEDGVRGGYHTRAMANDKIHNAAKITVTRHIENYDSCIADTKNIKNLRYQLLADLAEALEEKNILLYFVIPPFTYEYFEDPKLAPHKHSDKLTINRLLSETKNAKLLDFHDFFYGAYEPNALFLDDDHLNYIGAKVFSTKLKQEIENLERSEDGE